MANSIKFCTGLVSTIILIVIIAFISFKTRLDIFQKPLSIGEKRNIFKPLNTTHPINSSEIGIKCEMYQNTIMNDRVSKLGDVFNIKLKSIHEKISTLLLSILFTFIFLFSISVWYIISSLINSLSLVFIAYLLLAASAGSFVVVLIMLYKIFISFYKTDIFQFIAFLDCKNVNRDGLNKYLVVEDIYYYFRAMIIFGIVLISMFYDLF